MLTLFVYIITAALLIAMFFLALPLIAALFCSAVLLVVFGSQPLWSR